MNSVGIDVSKGKSMVAVTRPLGELVIAPFEVQHATDIITHTLKLDEGSRGYSIFDNKQDGCIKVILKP